MQLADFLDFDAIKTGMPGGNKRFATVASACQSCRAAAGDRPLRILRQPHRTPNSWGSTGFGQGVAIPHGKIDGLNRIYGNSRASR